MNKLISKAQHFGRKAADLRQAVQSLPGQAAKIREAVTMTGGELQQLRADVQSSLHGLKAESEDRLLKTMREVNDHSLVFEEAGYELTGLDLDLALPQRLAVHLDKFQEISQASLRALQSQQSCDAVRSIIHGIIKAEETAANLELSHLLYTGVVIHVGAIPMIRMSWRIPEEPIKEAPPVAAVPVRAAVPATPALGTMFEPRPFPTAGVRPVATSSAEPISGLAAASPHAAEPSANSWSQSALDRFKKMPGVSKYSR